MRQPLNLHTHFIHTQVAELTDAKEVTSAAVAGLQVRKGKN